MVVQILARRDSGPDGTGPVALVCRPVPPLGPDSTHTWPVLARDRESAALACALQAGDFAKVRLISNDASVAGSVRDVDRQRDRGEGAFPEPDWLLPPRQRERITGLHVLRPYELRAWQREPGVYELASLKEQGEVLVLTGRKLLRDDFWAVVPAERDDRGRLRPAASLRPVLSKLPPGSLFDAQVVPVRHGWELRSVYAYERPRRGTFLAHVQTADAMKPLRQDDPGSVELRIAGRAVRYPVQALPTTMPLPDLRAVFALGTPERGQEVFLRTVDVDGTTHVRKVWPVDPFRQQAGE